MKTQIIVALSIMTGDVIVIVGEVRLAAIGDTVFALTRYGVMEIYDPLCMDGRWKRIA